MEYVMDYSKFALEIYEFIQQQAKNAVSAIRTWLGPEPQDYYLLADGRVLPTTMILPVEIASTAYYYNVAKNQITDIPTGFVTHGRFKPAVPYLSMTIQQPGAADIDLSEWLGELRASPVPQNLPLKQLVTLWSLVKNTYVPSAYTLAVINDAGENETITIE